MVEFIDQHRAEDGVEPLCAQLPIAPATYYEFKAREAQPERQPPRVRRDAEVLGEIKRVYDDNYQVDGARKSWRQLRRDGISVARCTVERWFNNRRLLEPIGNIPPTEFESMYYRQLDESAAAA